MRVRTRIVVPAAATLALGAGVAAAVAEMQTTPTHTMSAHQGFSVVGAIAGSVVFARHQATGVVEVFNGTGRLVAHDDVRQEDRRFHFTLKSGQYQIRLKLAKRWIWDGCRYMKPVRVQANRTTHITLAEGCGTGTY